MATMESLKAAMVAAEKVWRKATWSDDRDAMDRAWAIYTRAETAVRNAKLYGVEGVKIGNPFADKIDERR